MQRKYNLCKYPWSISNYHLLLKRNGWVKAVHEDDKTLWTAGIKLSQETSFKYRFVRPDGSVAWVMGQAIPKLKNEIV
jgi:hypothetical protein